VHIAPTAPVGTKVAGTLFINGITTSAYYGPSLVFEGPLRATSRRSRTSTPSPPERTRATTAVHAVHAVQAWTAVGS
jgi:hypothetical protein